MLDIEVTIVPEMAGELAARMMSIWPDMEVETLGRGVHARLPVDRTVDRRLAQLEEVLRAVEEAKGLSPLDVRAVNLTGPDSGPERIDVGRFRILRPEAEAPPDPDKITLRLDPGAAFGTGGHPSTALTLLALDEFLTPAPGVRPRTGASVLDVGAGSGILSLASARLGAGPILAVDVVEEAIEAARRNAAANMIDSITVGRTLPQPDSGKFDLILANLVPSVLTRLLKRLVPLMAAEGAMIVSGFADAQTPQVVRVLTKTGLVIQKSYSGQGWTALTLILP